MDPKLEPLLFKLDRVNITMTNDEDTTLNNDN
jgi:hypothetical protein